MKLNKKNNKKKQLIGITIGTLGVIGATTGALAIKSSIRKKVKDTGSKFSEDKYINHLFTKINEVSNNIDKFKELIPSLISDIELNIDTKDMDKHQDNIVKILRLSSCTDTYINKSKSNSIEVELGNQSLIKMINNLNRLSAECFKAYVDKDIEKLESLFNTLEEE